MTKQLIALLMLTAATAAQAQTDDSGLWLSAGAQKRVSKKAQIAFDATFRTRNDFKTVDRWSFGIDGSYKIKKWLKADAGYTFLYDNRKEKLTYNTDSEGNTVAYNNWRPAYWAPRHRFHVSLTGELKLGDFDISLRERWQYTYRPETTTQRYDFDNLQWEDKTVSSKSNHLLRSRLQVEYAPKKATFKPFVNAELFNSMALEKVRLTAGTDIRLTKHHELEVFYRYQATNDNDSDNDPNCHYIGAGYTFKF